jgi:hypothetical protein
MVGDRDYASSEPLTKNVALEIARRSVTDRFGEPPRYTYGQLWSLAGDMVILDQRDNAAFSFERF